MDPKRLKAYFLLTLVAVIWGVAGPVIKITLPSYSPFVFLTYRFLVSSLVLIPIYLVFKPKWPNSKKEIIILTIVGLVGSTINLAFTFYGFLYSTVLDATILSNTGPIFVVAAGALFLKEKITSREKLGIFITFIGALSIVIEPLLKLGNTNHNLLGNLLIIGANLSWVAYVILAKYSLKYKVDTLLLVTYMFFLGLITSFPFAIIQSKGITNLFLIISTAPPIAHIGVWYMAILSGALAYFLYQDAQKSVEASEATLFGYLSPLFAMPLAIFWLHEKITLPFVIGTLIVATGVLIAEYRKNSKLKTQN